MSYLLTESQEGLFIITFNRAEKHNAFDDKFLLELQQALEIGIERPEIKVILLKANGRHFSAGADIAWMQKMAQFSEEENLADAQILAKVMYTLYQSPKPTVVMVQGAAMGGGAGLIATCDIALATHQAKFCFSEVKLGLIPAVISPYVVRSIGERAASWLFMSAETFDAQRAYELGLVHYCFPEEKLEAEALRLAKNIAQWPNEAVGDAKKLVRRLGEHSISESLVQETAEWIAKKRVSKEGQEGLKAFLDKR